MTAKTIARLGTFMVAVAGLLMTASIASAAPVSTGGIDCLVGPHIPEKPLHEILVECTDESAGTDLQCWTKAHAATEGVDQCLPRLDESDLGPVACFFQPVIPETPVYYIVWACTLGDVAREPLGELGCQIVFGQGLVCEPIFACIPEAVICPDVHLVPGRDDVACAQSYPESELCEGDYVGYANYYVDRLTEPQPHVDDFPPKIGL